MPGLRTLVVVASEIEAEAVVKGVGAEPMCGLIPWERIDDLAGVDLVLSGIGQANAAAATALAVDPARHGAILSLGLGGLLPYQGDGPEIALRESVLASLCVPDTGLQTPEGFVDAETMGFPLGGFSGPNIPVDGELLERLRPMVDHLAPIATVSTCSGTDEGARAVALRTSAAVEAMEGAGVGLVAHHLSIRFAELRVASNTTGDRDGQRWDLRGALDVLGDVAGRVLGP